MELIGLLIGLFIIGPPVIWLVSEEGGDVDLMPYLLTMLRLRRRPTLASG